MPTFFQNLLIMSQTSYSITPEHLVLRNAAGEAVVSLPLTLSAAGKEWRVTRLESTPTGWIGYTADPAVTVSFTKGAQHLLVEWHAPLQGAAEVVYFPNAEIFASHAHAFIPDDSFGAFPVAVDRIFAVTSQAEMKLHLGLNEELWMIAPPPHLFALGDAQGAGIAVSVPECVPADATLFALSGGRLSVKFSQLSAVCDGGRLPRVYVDVNVGSRQDTLARHLAHARELGLVKEPKSQPDWWHNPLYCTWGDQCRLTNDGIATNQSLTRERILGWADKIRSFYEGEVNFIIDDGYFLGMGDFRLRPELYPTNAAFRDLIGELKKRNFRVILWYTPFWLAPDSPIVQEHPEWFLHRPDGSLLEQSPFWGKKYRYDWTHPEVPGHHRGILHFLLEELGADGIKVDMTYVNPALSDVVRYDPAWATGDAVFYRTLQIIHEEVQRINPEAFTTVNGIECYLQPFAGAVRLNDLFNTTDATAWYRRAELVNRLMPDMAIDVDGWPAGLEKLREYPFVASAYGAPVTYYLDGTEVGGEEIEGMDGKKTRTSVMFGEGEINRMASVWNTYAHAPVRESDRINIDAEKGVFERRDAQGALRALSLNYSVFIAYGGSEIRVTSNRDQAVAVPLEGRAAPTAAVAVRRDGTRSAVPLRVEGGCAHLTAQDAASGILYYALTNAQ